LSHYEYSGAADIVQHLLDAAKMKQGERPAAAPEKIPGKRRILAIDDMTTILNIIRAVLKGDYMVYGVTNHLDAIKMLTNNAIDLILLDVDMPAMNGIELLGHIRQIHGYEKKPIVFLTNQASMENVKMAMAGGATDFITKPDNAVMLRAMVQEHLK